MNNAERQDDRHRQWAAPAARLYVENLVKDRTDDQRKLVFDLLSEAEQGQSVTNTDPRLVGVEWKSLVTSEVLTTGPGNMVRIHDSVLNTFRDLNRPSHKVMWLTPALDEEVANDKPGLKPTLTEQTEDELFQLAKEGMGIEDLMTTRGLSRDVVRGSCRRGGERWVKAWRRKPI